MNRIHIDPSLLQCPDYASDAYTPARAPFVNDNTTDAQAIQLLINLWRAGNEHEKQLWQDQRQNDLAAEADEILHKQETAVQRAILLAQDQEAIRKEEMKKNKLKYIPIPDRPIPTITPVFASNYTIKKMERGQYLELWYYTNAGLDEAMKINTSVDDDAMIISRRPDGSTSWVPATTARDSKRVIDNKDIPWEDFCQAVPRMIIAMEEADWPPERIVMLASFWGNLQVHELRSSRDPLDQKTLLLYQARQRRLWHLAIPSPRGAYNIATIDETIMRTTKEEIYWDDRAARDNERDFRVSAPFSPSAVRPLTIAPSTYPIPISHNPALHSPPHAPRMHHLLHRALPQPRHP